MYIYIVWRMVDFNFVEIWREVYGWVFGGDFVLYREVAKLNVVLGFDIDVG